MGLDIVEFLIATEQEFDLKLPDDEVSVISTVGELTDLVYQKLLVKHGLIRCPSNEVVYQKIKELLYQEQKISSERISRSSRFVQDLHLD